MPDDLTVRWVEREVSWLLQTRDEVAVENAIFFRFLRSQLSAEVVNDWINSYLDSVESQIKELGDPGAPHTAKVDMLQVGGGLTFWPYLARTYSVRHPSDPINAIFWGYGTPDLLSDLLRNSVGGWGLTVGTTLYALIDDTTHGGTVSWKRFDQQLRKGSFWGRSQHVRLYGGTRLCTHGKGSYTLAGVHEEQLLSWPPHTPLSWDNARDALEQDIQSVPGRTGSTIRIPLVASGNLQGVSYDGQAAYIEMVRPPWLSSVP